MTMASSLSKPDELPAFVEGLPNICGWEATIEAVTSRCDPVFLARTNLRLSEISAGFAIALHMHQPMIPAGNAGALVNNLQHMFEHPYEGDNYNAGPFAYCYGRIGDFVPELVSQGCNPRVMLDYTGTLLWGLQAMGRTDILDKLKRVTCDEQYQPYVEWLGTFWGHAVADAIPLMDIKLQIRAWQHHFAAIFGMEALRRVRGFSLPEMKLPEHPETLYQLVKALRDCGYQWLLVKESDLETLTGEEIKTPNIPHRLIARGHSGMAVEITLLVQAKSAQSGGVAQMSPYYDSIELTTIELGSAGLGEQTVASTAIPAIVTQIDDGENEGRMMNEFPSAFKRAWHQMETSQHGNTAFNGTEYLELLAAAGIQPEDFPSCRGAQRHKGGNVVEQSATAKNHHDPIEKLSQRFHRIVDEPASTQLTQQHQYRNALLHNLLLQTSCFRSWGEGEWTDYAQEIYRRGIAILEHDF